MDTRYQHPQVTDLWSREWTLDAWWRIEQALARAQSDTFTGPDQLSPPAIDRRFIFETKIDFTDAVEEIDKIEERTRHDVAAFLQFVRSRVPAQSARWIHFGLTSSDLVDTAQALRFKYMLGTLRPALSILSDAIAWWRDSKQMVLGRTHGQPAEPISMGMRAEHWYSLYNSAEDWLIGATDDMVFGKMSGPVGNFAHNSPWIESRVMQELGLVGQGQGATQIVPRVRLARWATCAAQLVAVCAKIAMDMRLMLLLGEARELKGPGQVGSSAMAHKKNPIRAEKITGLQRVAAGYAGMLQPLDLWLERDISNSSVERIVVPDLWHVLMHVIEETTSMVRAFEVGYRGDVALANHIGEANVHRVTLVGIERGMSVDESRAWALMVMKTHPLGLEADGIVIPQTDPAYFARNWAYPEETP